MTEKAADDEQKLAHSRNPASLTSSGNEVMQLCLLTYNLLKRPPDASEEPESTIDFFKIRKQKLLHKECLSVLMGEAARVCMRVCLCVRLCVLFT